MSSEPAPEHRRIPSRFRVPVRTAAPLVAALLVGGAAGFAIGHPWGSHWGDPHPPHGFGLRGPGGWPGPGGPGPNPATAPRR